MKQKLWMSWSTGKDSALALYEIFRRQEFKVEGLITHMAFGDLYLEEIRDYRIKMLSGTGITPVFPLWGLSTTDLAARLITLGFKAIVTCVDTKKLPQSFVGRTYDASFLTDLPPNIDPCAENGEFHTFVYSSPNFRNPLKVKVGEIVERDGFCFADVVNL